MPGASLTNLEDYHWTLSRTEQTDLGVFLQLCPKLGTCSKDISETESRSKHTDGGGGMTKKSVIFGEINELHGLDPREIISVSLHT